MSKTITISKKDLKALIAAEVDLKVAAKEGKKAAKKRQPKKLRAAKKHCYEARMARRAEGTADGRGMTKAEKSALWADLVAKHGEEKAKAKWGKACLKFKAAN